jgi:hypothetical protein
MLTKPKISRRQAEIIFSIKKSAIPKFPKLSFRNNSPVPERLEMVYVPFYLFDVLVEKENKGNRESFTPKQYVTLTVDGLLGHAMLFAANALDAEKDEETPVPVCDFAISSADAAKLALDQYKGILLEHGLRTRSHSYATKISEGMKIYFPFWVGYFKKKRGYDFKALDAVSGEIQGVRMRRVFMKALKSLE